MAEKKERSFSTQPKKRQTAKRRRISKEEREREVRLRLLMIGGGVGLVVILILLIAGISSHSRKESVPDASANSTAGSVDTEADASTLVEMIPIAEVTGRPVELYADKPDIDITDWKYILANSEHSVEDYEPIVDYLEGIPLDYRVIEPMSAFVEDAREQGLSVVIASGYRSYEEQTWTFELQLGMMEEEEAAKVVARPGTSEHQTGLAADITDDYYEIKTEDLENTDLYRWMSTHCQDYGFIVRFPKDKEDITGIIYEPWHFRYVGETAARYIMEKGLCLEEFVALYES